MTTRSGEARSRPCLRALAVAALAALPLGACSFSLPSFGGDPPEQTGSVTPPFRSPLSPALDVEDWRRARAAMGVAIDPQGSGSSVAWDNPDSGLKGTFVPVGQPFVQADLVCRIFIATIGGTLPEPSSLQGTACRLQPDEWDVSGVKPWKKPI